MTLDDWDQYTFEFVRSIGNAGANEFLEHNEAYVVWQGLGKREVLAVEIPYSGPSWG